MCAEPYASSWICRSVWQQSVALFNGLRKQKSNKNARRTAHNLPLNDGQFSGLTMSATRARRNLVCLSRTQKCETDIRPWFWMSGSSPHSEHAHNNTGTVTTGWVLKWITLQLVQIFLIPSMDLIIHTWNVEYRCTRIFITRIPESERCGFFLRHPLVSSVPVFVRWSVLNDERSRAHSDADYALFCERLYARWNTSFSLEVCRQWLLLVHSFSFPSLHFRSLSENYHFLLFYSHRNFLSEHSIILISHIPKTCRNWMQKNCRSTSTLTSTNLMHLKEFQL